MNDDREIVRYRNKSGAQTAILINRGRKWTTLAIITDDGVRLVKDDAPRLEPLERHGKPYPLERALRHYRRIAREKGATRGARAALREGQ